MADGSAKLEEWSTPPARLFNRLNFSSLLLLSKIDNDLKRAFYEQKAIRGRLEMANHYVVRQIWRGMLESVAISGLCHNKRE